MNNLNAPRKDALPARRNRTRLNGKECREIKIGIQTITPILGGGATARELDSVDVIRVPTIRGHLRFWWRALYGYQYGLDFEELYRRERELWGGADRDGAVKSSVEISVASCRHPSTAEIDDADPNMRDISSYALWPARGQKRGPIPVPAAKRLKENYSFDLHLAFSPVNASTDAEIRNVLRAWILFGGYGSRTRRGVGSITVQTDIWREWLPAAVTRECIKTLFNNDDILASSSSISAAMPSLRGAALIVGKKTTDKLNAWKEALGWLRNFRQDTDGGAGNRARNPDPDGGNRASISNWPEADKIRQLSRPKPGTTWAHPPRYSRDPAWPRASFGLPIIGKYQEKNRAQQKWGDLFPALDEPGEFELRWSPNSRSDNDESSVGSRLASPLIVKALPLADGQFVPCALWLNRAYPDGKVVLEKKVGGTYTPVRGSEAPFDKIAGATDTLLFNPLVGKATVREAFLDWLVSEKKCTQVAP